MKGSMWSHFCNQLEKALCDDLSHNTENFLDQIKKTLQIHFKFSDFFPTSPLIFQNKLSMGFTNHIQMAKTPTGVATSHVL